MHRRRRRQARSSMARSPARSLRIGSRKLRGSSSLAKGRRSRQRPPGRARTHDSSAGRASRLVGTGKRFGPGSFASIMRSWKSGRDRIGLRSASSLRIQVRLLIAGVDATHAGTAAQPRASPSAAGQSEPGSEASPEISARTALSYKSIGVGFLKKVFKLGEGLAVVSDCEAASSPLNRTATPLRRIQSASLDYGTWGAADEPRSAWRPSPASLFYILPGPRLGRCRARSCPGIR